MECKHCGTDVKQVEGKRAKEYCSEAHKKAYSRSKQKGTDSLKPGQTGTNKEPVQGITGQDVHNGTQPREPQTVDMMAAAPGVYSAGGLQVIKLADDINGYTIDEYADMATPMSDLCRKTKGMQQVPGDRLYNGVCKQVNGKWYAPSQWVDTNESTGE